MYEEVISWLDHEGRVSDLMVQINRDDANVVTGFVMVYVDKMEPRSAASLLVELADIPVIDATATDEQALWIQINRAKSMVAHKSKRAMGNSMITCHDGCLITYVGSHPYDRPAMWIADQQYVAVNGFHNHFAFLQGDPEAIMNAFISLREKLNTAA